MLRKSKNPQTISGFWAALELQDKVVVLMTLGLIAAAFFLGFFYGQLRVLQGGGVSAGTGSGNPIAAAPGGADPGVGEAAAPGGGSISEDLWQELLADPAAEKGPSDAAVVMVEFTDYQCPFCKRHFDETAGLIEDNFVSSGDIRYVIRDLPLSFHANANIAAQAARCAGDQDKYWEMHDALFENQNEWSVGDAAGAFSKYAGTIGLNVGTFDSCVSNETHKDAVEADLALATRAGATGTPTFVINGSLLVGAQPYSAFESTIQQNL